MCEHKDISVLMESNVDDLFQSHGDIWNGLKTYYYKHRGIPDISVLEQQFLDFEPTPVKAETSYYLEQLRNQHLSTRLGDVMLKAGKALNSKAPADVLERLQSEIMKLTRFSTTVRDIDATDWQEAEQYFEKIAARAAEMGGSVGIPTQYKSIDASYPTGMSGGHLIYIIGWPGRGKTWFATSLAIKAWEQGFKPMIVSLEMSPEDMRNRVYGLIGSGLFRVSDFQKGAINTDQFRTWGKKTFADKNQIVLVSSDGQDNITPNHVQAKIDQHRPDLVICDYHQLFTDNARSQSTQEATKNISKEFKRMAVSNNIPIIDITAGTKEETADLSQPPLMSHVAWSKSLEYDADLAIAVHRHRDEGNRELPTIEVIGRKNRHGPDFAFFLDIDLNRGIMSESHGA